MKIFRVYSSMCVAAVLLMGIVTGHAHSDTILELKGTTLVGLPKEFTRAEFSLEKKILRINDREMVFAPIIAGFFPEPENYDLVISASWYHDKEEMPHYINFQIKWKNRDFEYQILINLDTLELIHVVVEIQETTSTARWFEINLSKWDEEIAKSVRKVPENN